MAAEPKRYWWDKDEAARIALLQDAVESLLGADRKLSHTHALVCADWALREFASREKLEQRMRALLRSIAQAAEIASDGPTHTCAHRAQEPS